MPRSLARFPRLLTGFAFPQTAIAGEGWHTSFLGPLSEPIWRWLDSPAMLPAIAIAVAVIGLCVLVAGNLRMRRRHARLAISGLRNGARFRVVDAMCHAVWDGRTINTVRVKRALQIARDTTGMDFTSSHIQEMAQRADRIIIPTNFNWMREDLNREEKLLIFNATLSVLLADGPMGRSDRVFLRTLARGLRLGRTDLRALARLITTS
jgi:hypothetical protein